MKKRLVKKAQKIERNRLKTALSYDNNLKTITTAQVRIEFSDNIAWWDEKGYHEQVAFTRFWDKVNSMRKYQMGKSKEHQYCDNLWNVYYTNKYCMEKAEEEKLETSVLRMLGIYNSSNFTIISPKMHIQLIHHPSKFPATLSACIQDLMELCADCAKACKGTVKIAISQQQRFYYENDLYKTFEVGTGIEGYKLLTE